MKLTVKQARLLSGFTQKKVAEKLNVHRDTFAKWESESDLMPVGKAKQFSRIVEKSYDDIFFG